MCIAKNLLSYEGNKYFSCHRFAYVLPVLLFMPPLGVGILLPMVGDRSFAPVGTGLVTANPPALPAKRTQACAHQVQALTFRYVPYIQGQQKTLH